MLILCENNGGQALVKIFPLPLSFPVTLCLRFHCFIVCLVFFFPALKSNRVGSECHLIWVEWAVRPCCDGPGHACIASWQWWEKGRQLCNTALTRLGNTVPCSQPSDVLHLGEQAPKVNTVANTATFHQRWKHWASCGFYVPCGLMVHGEFAVGSWTPFSQWPFVSSPLVFSGEGEWSRWNLKTAQTGSEIVTERSLFWSSQCLWWLECLPEVKVLKFF